MRAIAKLHEPASLAQHRSQEHADFENYSDKPHLREQLVEEQRGLCCYCTGRIRPDPNAMKIEHWHSQRDHPEEQLQYSNLLGACNGNDGQPGKIQHCDTKKGYRELSKNPALSAHQIEAFIYYGTDGKIGSHDAILNQELDSVLNLNIAFLKSNRKAVLDAFKEGLNKRGHLDKDQLSKLHALWHGDQPGQLDPYSPVVAYWLRKRLAKE